MVASPFRYPGGKTKKSVRNKILSKAPKNFKRYIECFVGGGGIFFSIDPSIPRWINDIDSGLMEVYKALRDRPDDFINKCCAIEPQKSGEKLTSAREGGKSLYNARLKEWFDWFVDNEDCDQAIRWFFLNRTNFAGRVNCDIKSRMYFSCPQGWNIVKTTKLYEAADCLKNTKITCLDYSTLLREPGDDIWIYLDPPYVKNTGLARNSQLYKYGFTIEDHVKLAENVKKCNHMVLLSYDDDEFVRDLYKGFNIYAEEWTYCGTSSAEKQSKTKKKGKELIITNYE